MKKFLRLCHSPLLSLILAGVLMAAGTATRADDTDIYTNANVLPRQAPLTMLALDLNLLDLNAVACTNVLLPPPSPPALPDVKNADCLALQQALTLGNLIDTVSALSGSTPAAVTTTLATATALVPDLRDRTIANVLNMASNGDLVGTLVGSVVTSLGTVLGSQLGALTQALPLYLTLSNILHELVDTRVGIMINHGDANAAGDPAASCPFPDASSLGGQRQDTPSCSNGGYFFLGLLDLTRVDEVLTKLMPLLTSAVTGLLNGSTVSGPLIDKEPYQTKELYAEFIRYLTGGTDSIFNGKLGARDNVLVSTLPRDTTIETNGNRDYKGALQTFDQACSINFVHVQVTPAAVQNESDVELARLLPDTARYPRNSDGSLSLASVVDSASKDGFVYGTDRRRINSFFLVPDFIGNLGDLSALRNLGGNVSTTTDLLGLISRGRDIARAVVKRTLIVDSTFGSIGTAASRSSATGTTDAAYLTLFRPAEDSSGNPLPAWYGNLKKLKLRANGKGFTPVDALYNFSSTDKPTVVDSAIAADGRIRADALTFWTDPTKLGGATKDGRKTDLGGAGQKVPGFVFGGGGNPGRGGTGSARKMFYDSATAGPVTLAVLNADSAAVRAELTPATGGANPPGTWTAGSCPVGCTAGTCTAAGCAPDTCPTVEASCQPDTQVPAGWIQGSCTIGTPGACSNSNTTSCAPDTPPSTTSCSTSCTTTGPVLFVGYTKTCTRTCPTGCRANSSVVGPTSSCNSTSLTNPNPSDCTPAGTPSCPSTATCIDDQYRQATYIAGTCTNGCTAGVCNSSGCAPDSCPDTASCAADVYTPPTRPSNASLVSELLLYARGYDVGTRNSPKGTGPTNSPTDSGISSRPWMLGAVLHSKPVAINYGKRNGATNPEDIRVVFGSADGVLHMVDDATGVENWGFMPQEVMGNLNTLRENVAGSTMPYGVDGTAVVLIRDKPSTLPATLNQMGVIGDAIGDSDPDKNDRVLLFFGLRRGGKAYYALDVTNPDAPVMQWRLTASEGLRNSTGLVTGSASQFAPLALAFSTPQVGKLRIDASGTITDPNNDVSTKSVLIFGGGYNGGGSGSSGTTTRIGKDRYNSRNALLTEKIGTNDGSAGTALFIVDAATGNLIWRAIPGTTAAYTASTKSYAHPRLEDSVAGDITLLDTDNDGISDRLYVGDTGGRLWRGDFAGVLPSAWTFAPIASVGRHNGGTSAVLADDRRIFGAPDYVPLRGLGNAKMDLVLFGTGDREDPLNRTTKNWFYGLIDQAVVSGKAATAIITAESSLPQHTDFTDATSTPVTNLNTLTTAGYRKLLPGKGEKMFTSSVTLGNTASFASFTPIDPDNPNTPVCVPDEGLSKLYTINVRTTAKSLLNAGTSRAGEVLPKPGLPGDISVLPRTAQAVSNEVYSIPATETYRASWRERLGETQK